MTVSGNNKTSEVEFKNNDGIRIYNINGVAVTVYTEEYLRRKGIPVIDVAIFNFDGVEIAVPSFDIQYLDRLELS